MLHEEYIVGRGAQKNTSNPYHKQSIDTDSTDGLDEAFKISGKTTFYMEHSKKVVNKVTSPDINIDYFLNPYQGCEHGCSYCYARNTHQYWGWSAGIDFEQKIIVKENAPEQLEALFNKPNWAPKPIGLSGNTDCYQPAESKFRITRRLLEVFLKYRHPLGIITKNKLILRDLDILSELAKLGLVNVAISLTTLNENLRRVMEPRTATSHKRLEVIEKLSSAGIPVRLMMAPIIPGLNDHEIPTIIEKSALAGASSSGYTIVRLNGAVQDIFKDWLKKNFPDKYNKVTGLIADCHGGQLNNSVFGKRMRGEGNVAKYIAETFKIHSKKHFSNKTIPPLRTDLFTGPHGKQLGIEF